MRHHRGTLSARLVQCSKRHIDVGTRRQRGHGRVLRRRLLPQSRGARHDAQWRYTRTREILLRTGHPEIRRAREERDKVHIVRRCPRHTRVRRQESRVVGSSSARSMFVRAYSIVHLRRGFESLYVYSGTVEPRIVGDKIAPLLRIVPITGRHWEMVAASLRYTIRTTGTTFEMPD